MPVDVVVVNYKTPDLLQDFIRSYEALELPGCTLTIVEVEANIPEDWLRAEESNSRQTLFFRENIGYGKACNEGAALGHNSIILFANADTLLSDGFRECHDALRDHPNWGVLGPRQVNEFNCFTAGGIPGGPHGHVQRGWNQTDVGQCSDVLEDVYSVSGSLYFIKRSVWKELTECPVWKEYAPNAVGAFLETRHYFEETTCSRHLTAHGHINVFYGSVKMTHLFHRSSDHGGWQDREVTNSKTMHREFLALHGIEHE
jgi:hypothetical protein